MLSYNYLFDIALILISTKLFGMLTRRFHMPQVVGALLAGLILGPAMFNILHETAFIQQMAELGVIVLMFTAGLETDLQELKKSGAAASFMALLGVILPLIGGFLVATFFNTGEGVATSVLLQNIFIGVILTATSVSITAETLKELGKISSKAGTAILSAALIDDVLGLIALTVITSLADTSVNIWMVLLKILLFFVCAILFSIVIYKLFDSWIQHYTTDLRRFVIAAFVICLLFAFSAEHFFGVADITGAFIAGLIISGTSKAEYIKTRFDTMAYMLLSPIFFASIGIKIELPPMTTQLILFTIVLLLVAIATKIIGCGLAAKCCHYSTHESLQIGVGMSSRGEVALIVATKGAAVGLMGATLFGPVVIMVVATAVLTPIFLKLAFKGSDTNQTIPSSLDSSH